MKDINDMKIEMLRKKLHKDSREIAELYSFGGATASQVIEIIEGAGFKHGSPEWVVEVDSAFELAELVTQKYNEFVRNGDEKKC